MMSSLPCSRSCPAHLSAVIVAALVGVGLAHATQGSCGQEAELDGSSLLQAPRQGSKGRNPYDGAQLIVADSAELYYVDVSGDNFLFKGLTTNPAAGPFNKPCPFKDCGGYVFATNGGPGKFQAALPGLDTNGGAYGSGPFSRFDSNVGVGAVAQVEMGSAFSCVLFHILPNGTHPWHVHEHMNEFVTVIGGAGILDIIDPETQKVYTVPAVIGRVLTLPHGYMHMFRASREGLDLLAFGDVQGATLALLPTFMAVLPEGLRSTILGQETAEAVGDGWQWLGGPPSGNAFICEPNSDYVQKVLDSNAIIECSYGVAGTPHASTLPCVTKPIPDSKTFVEHSFLTYGSLLPTGDAECIADGAWCTIRDLSFSYAYVQMKLRPRQLLAGLMPSGAMIGYVTKGTVWVAFYHPNSAYLIQFTASETDLLYIPGDVYLMFLSLDDGEVQVNLGIQSFQKTGLKPGFGTMKIMPLTAALAQMEPLLSGAAFYPDLEQAAQNEATKESTVLNKPLKQPSLVFKLSESIYEKLRADISTWNSTDILCLSSNSFCYCKDKECALAEGLPKCAEADLPEGLLSVSQRRAAKGRDEARGNSANNPIALAAQVAELQEKNEDLMMRVKRLEELLVAK